MDQRWRRADLADKIELGDELVKILLNSFVEMCQEVPRAKTAREQFLRPVAGEFCSRKLSDIFFYRPDIPRSTLTISEHNYIKWCHWVHRLDLIPKGLWVRGAGLKLFIVSMNNLLTCLCTGYYVWLNNDGAKLGMLSDIIVLTYSFRLVLMSFFVVVMLLLHHLTLL